MGTRGLRIVRYRGRYWCFYNHWDSYLDGMGNSLVETIPTDPHEYKIWLQTLHERFAKWDALLQDFLCVKADHLSTITSNRAVEEFLDEAFDSRLEAFPTSTPASLNTSIEYMYTFDLDQEVFSVDNTAHFRLQHIPRNGQWMDAICQDRNWRNFVHPRLTPKGSVGTLARDNNAFSPEDEAYWKGLPTREIAAKADCTNVSSHLRLKLFDFFEDGQLPDLRVTLLSWTANDLLFRELAFFIMCLAAGGDYLRIVDERRVLFPSASQLYGVVDHGEGSEGERELINSVGDGFHLEGYPIGSAPSSSKYWFEGALVCLVPRLDQDGVVEKAMADAIRHGREACGRTSFNAVLISIGHLVLLRSFPDGRVEHSPIMRLLSTNGSRGLDARQYYGKIWLDNFYNDKMPEKENAKQAAAAKEAEDKKAHNAVLAGRDDKHDSTNQDPGTTDKDESVSSANELIVHFSGLSHVNATSGLAAADSPIQDSGEETRDAMTGHDAAETHDGTVSEPTSDGSRVKPPVTPIDTEPPADVARSHGDIGASSCSISNDNREDEHEEKESEETVDKKSNTGGEAQEEQEEEEEEEKDPVLNIDPVQHPWEAGSTFSALISFLEATTLETLRPMDGSRQNLPTELTEMILGYVFDEKTYDACLKVSRAFRSFCLQRPLLTDGVRLLEVLPTSTEAPVGALRLRAEDWTGQRLVISVEKKGDYSDDTSVYRFVAGKEWNRRSFCPRTPIVLQGLDAPAPFDLDIREPPRRRDPWLDRRSKPGDSVWLEARARYGTDDIDALGRLWDLAVKKLFRDLRGGLDSSFLQEPQNEAWLRPANTRQFSIHTNLYTYDKYERYLILRIKRASKYWDCLWNDSIEEIKKVLAGLDDDSEVRRKKLKQLVGAANPAVILAVGLEVRLFEWSAEAATLTETVPNRVYQVMDEGDSKVIEAVLTYAVWRSMTAERKEKPGFDDE
ncbi:MAG: hypothetical protein LQ345_003354 [Seirophora villosa]|nr:MAG: hypothetical protein LQ345_003354 [Seirophora villosa]